MAEKRRSKDEEMAEWFGEDDVEDVDGVPNLTIPALGQVPPSVPIQWAGMDNRPYETPGEEFIRSIYPLSMATICYRWAKLYEPEDIHQLCQEQNWKQKRFEYQDRVMDEALQQAMSKDVNLQTRIVNRDIINFSSILETLQADFASGEEYRPTRNAGPFAYAKIPMAVDSKVKLANSAVNVSNLLATRVGLATQIIEKNTNISVDAKSELRTYMMQEDPEYARMKELANLGRRTFESEIAAEIEKGAQIYDAVLVEGKGDNESG